MNRKSCGCHQYTQNPGDFYIFCRHCKSWFSMKVPVYISKEQEFKYASGISQKLNGSPNQVIENPYPPINK